MGWCAGRDGDQAAPPSLGPFLCNRRGAFFCVRRPRKSPRTEARAEFHVAGVVRQGIRRREEEYQRGAEEDPASRRRAGSSERRAGIPTKRSRIPAEFADQMSRADKATANGIPTSNVGIQFRNTFIKDDDVQ